MSQVSFFRIFVRAVHRIIDRPVQLYDKARVAPNIQSSGGTDGRIFEFPRITHPSAVPKVKLRVAPNPLVVKLRRLFPSSGCPESSIDGRVNDESPSVLELSISGLRRG